MAQHFLINSIKPNEFEIIALQEPHINSFNNTISSRRYHILYPSMHLMERSPKTRVVILISASLNKNAWKQIPYPSADVVIVQLSGDYGHCTLINIYNDCTHNDTLMELGKYLDTNICQIRLLAHDHMIWLGDFNCHHPLWEEERNNHLLTNRHLDHAQPLLELIADYGMLMALPKDTPTLEALATKNWTRPDNIFCMEITMGALTYCYMDPAQQSPCTDHVPILTSFELHIPNVDVRPSRNFNNVDWKGFNRTLKAILSSFPTNEPIVSEPEFQRIAKGVLDAILTTIEEHVPTSHPCPHAKRWWTRELSQMREHAAKLASDSYKARALTDHLSHEKYRVQRNKYTEAIKQTKYDHWLDWLENINSEEIWIANKYLNAEPSDGSSSRIPSLNHKDLDGSLCIANSNEEKSKVLAATFFPPPPTSTSVPPDFEYPDPVTDPGEITEEQIECCIKKLSPMKAPGPDGIRNIVFKKCSGILVPHLLHLFCATFLLRTYFDPWREFTTVVLRKPGKPDYTIPKAYRPIALLNTTGKLLTAIIADQLSHLLETNNLLPATHFGGCPGRSMTDSLHLLEATIKNAWRAGKVASALFLDIEGAFPNAVTKRLLHNMHKCKIPPSLIDFTELALTGRCTKLSFDGYLSDWIPITNGIRQGDPISMVLYIIYNSDLIEIAANKNEVTLAFVDDTAFLTIGKNFTATHAILSDMVERPGEDTHGPRITTPTLKHQSSP